MQHLETFSGFVQPRGRVHSELHCTHCNYRYETGVCTSSLPLSVQEMGKGIVESSEIAAEIVGLSAQSILRWTRSLFISLATWSEPIGNFDDGQIEHQLSSEQGCGSANHSSLVHDERFQLKAREFGRQHANKKGEPNMTVAMFQQWVQDTFDKDIYKEIARLWLHKLGFQQRSHTNCVYFDGHDREDVVIDRQQFLS